MARKSPPLVSAPMEPVGLALQPVLSERINVLLGWARVKERNWNRRDVVAALVYDSPKTPEDFERLIERYRAATIDAARLDGQPRKARKRQPGRVAHTEADQA